MVCRGSRLSSAMGHEEPELDKRKLRIGICLAPFDRDASSRW
jgi:hypothetical protein